MNGGDSGQQLTRSRQTFEIRKSNVVGQGTAKANKQRNYTNIDEACEQSRIQKELRRAIEGVVKKCGENYRGESVVMEWRR